MQASYPTPNLAVDVVALAVTDGALRCLLMHRDDADLVGGDWALPGAFVHYGKPLEEALERALVVKAGLRDIHVEQLATYGDPARDPRGHVVSITYLALTRPDILNAAIAERDDLMLATLSVDWSGEAGGLGQALDASGRALPLAFDHAAILGDTVKRLRGKLNYSPIGFAFLPPRFTLRAVQEVHEAILGRKLTKPAFRRKLADRHPIRPTGELETGGAFRPAELYELDLNQEA